jgi:LacI family repressor for deo operon, udp, cdd, tsx, nupC, and nupG
MTGDFSIPSGSAAAEQLLDRAERPTAVFCFNDEMAIGVIDTARRRGVAVPRQLSVIGFDDIRFARHVDPPLTTIAQPMRDIGHGTVRLLLQILAGRESRPQSVTLPHALIVRASTAPPLSD